MKPLVLCATFAVMAGGLTFGTAANALPAAPATAMEHASQALDDVQNVRYVCRRVWRHGHWHRRCWWEPNRHRHWRHRHWRHRR